MAEMGQILTSRSAPACLLPPTADIAMFAGRAAPKKRASATGPNVPAAPEEYRPRLSAVRSTGRAQEYPSAHSRLTRAGESSQYILCDVGCSPTLRSRVSPQATA